MSRLGIANTMRLAHFLQPAQVRPPGPLAQDLVSNPIRYPARGKWWTQSPANRDERRLGHRHLNVPPAPRSCVGGFGQNYRRTFWRAAFVHRALIEATFKISGRRRISERYPSFLDFATSSDVLSVVSHYLQSIPALSTTLPPGIRVMESNAAFDDQPDKPHDSQLYHMDYYSLPLVYILVLLRDTTPEHGPWTFLPRGVSQKTRRALNYWSRQRAYRVSDEDIYSVVDRKEAIEFCYPRGTVLFIESSGCFHYGSRNSIKPRFILMIGYTGACRTDFSEVIRPHKVYPVRETDSRLRKMALNKNMLG